MPERFKVVFFIAKTIKLTPRPRTALNGATLQQQLTVHNTGAEPKNVLCTVNCCDETIFRQHRKRRNDRVRGKI